MKKMTRLLNATRFSILAIWLGWASSSQADLLLNFPFNEGSGTTTTDTASSLTGIFGVQQNPAVDTVQLMDASPSGLAGDRSITNSGAGFLLADDSSSRVLDITEGPITMECWVYIDLDTSAAGNQGIAAYGNSYKLGMRGGWLVFTLFGFVDITNTFALVPAGNWVHLAAAWNPGEGVRFYVNGVEESFQPNTTPAARAVSHNYLSILSEGFGNNTVMALDRLRIHHALLTATDVDSVAATPKAPLTNTLVSYNFNEAAFPSTNAIAPPLPTMLSSAFLASISSPVWTNDTPAGMAGDYALAFLTENPPIKEFVTVDYGATVIDLGANNFNYTLQAWVKLPPGLFNERRVIFRSEGPAPRISFSINADRTVHTTILGTQDFFSNVAVPDDNRWHHVAAVVQDFDRVHFYLDGVLRRTVIKAGTTDPNGDTTPARLLIGKESETRYFRGLLDRVKVHNEVLTNSTLDYPAIPGLAVFQTQPVGILVNAGSDATFTAIVDSPTAAMYQWFRRANLTDPVGAPIPGETSTTLTLNSVGLADEGAYSLVVTNAAGVSESHGARLTVRPPSVVVTTIDFEAPTYTSGNIGGQDSPAWIATGSAAGNQVLTDAEITNALEVVGITPGVTVQSGTQALFFSAHGVAASTLVRPVTGLESESKVTMDVWVRGLLPGNTTAPIGNMFFAIEGTAGTSGRAAFIGLRDTAAAAQVGPYFGYGSAVLPGSWGRVGLFDGDSWDQLTAIFDYTAKTYDFFINGVEAARNVPFVHAVADSFRQLRIFRGANQAGAIIDNLSLSVPSVATDIQITNITIAGSTITVTWEGGQPPYQLQRRNNVTGGNWENVGSSTSSTQATDTLGDGMMFYRVAGN